MGVGGLGVKGVVWEVGGQKELYYERGGISLLGLLEPLAPVDVNLLLTHFLKFHNVTYHHKTLVPTFCKRQVS